MFDRDRWYEIWSSLAKNKVRTFFTAFGVFWGIFMLMIMLGSGNGLENGITYGMGDLATNSVFMWTRPTTEPYKGFPRNRRYYFRNDDIQALKDNIPEMGLVAPRLEGGGRQAGNNVIYKQNAGAFNIYGDYPEWNKIDPAEMVQGRFLNANDINHAKKVAVIGRRVYEVLFEKDENPIGKYIRIRGVYFQVIGVFKPKNMNFNFGGDKEQSIHIPFTTLQKVYNYGNIVAWFALTSQPDVDVSVIEQKASKLLKERHNVSPDDHRAVGSVNLEKEFKQMTGLFMGINGLIWIVGIGTLLAGVIGISNIMLVIVKERTKEIGIMRALGASPLKVISQIVTESVVLTSIAGYAGLVFGVLIMELIDKNLPEPGNQETMFMHPVVDFQVAMVALAIVVFSGVLAGLIPARKAVSIKPIDALRYE
ncbi:MAG TPA: ABC transporter permease [Bacteroidales bacterium]|jgi:putative ABC transport system permease protein|nr:ABC transporter permease [Bacteroidales bacterium]MDD4086246.1 ABC transporter permease [Bacteroidales bacterium]MDY0085299.1 ABC transporter permease [Bacteroidales bacterium]HPE42657.1 ABC transporter permease [Bacteroidales bacterium]